MDGATLTIEFRDQTPGGGPQGSVTPPQGPQAPKDLTQAQLEALLAAGGAKSIVPSTTTTAATTATAVPVAPTVAEVPVATAPPSPATTTSAQPSGDPLRGLVEKMLFADPKATAEEIAKAIGAELKQIKQLMGGSEVSLPSTSGGVPVRGNVDTLVASTKKMWDDDLATSTRLTWERQSRAAEFANAKDRPIDAEVIDPRLPKPPPLSIEQEIQEAERRAPPIQFKPPDTSEAARGAKDTVNAISHFTHGFGPLGSAIAGTVTSAMNVPGVASAVAGAAPALIAAAPYIAAAAASVAIPVAAIGTVATIAETVRLQARGLSPELAQAEAQTEIRQLLANIRTARELGDEAAGYLTQRSRISTGLQGIRDFVAEPLIQDLNANMRILADGINSLNNLLPEEGTAGRTLAHQGIRGLAALSLNAIFPGLGHITLANSFLGNKEAKDEAVGGLFGIIPPRPKLPPPFTDSDLSVRSGTFPKTPKFLPGFGGIK